MRRIARVFLTKTSMTPDDELAFVNTPPPLLAMPEVDEVHISVTFTWDMRRAEELEKDWRVLGVPVRVGGPAFNQPGGRFIPGMYVKKGCTITSRGCPNHCWFCAVPKRERGLREMDIVPGYNVLDDNLLACSDDHVRKVFAMLAQQKERPIFSGGLEAKIIKPWHCEELRKLKPRQMYFAYDTPDDYEPLVEAGKMLRDAGFPPHSHSIGCYVLCGYPKDTMEKAEQRFREAIRAGFVPYAMLYRDQKGETVLEWRRFQREWIRPALINRHIKEESNNAGTDVACAGDGDPLGGVRGAE